MTDSTKKGHRTKSSGVPAAVLLLALALCASPATNAQFHVQLSPQLLSTDVKPGQKGQFEFELVNPDKTVDLQVRLNCLSKVYTAVFELSFHHR